MSIRQEFVLQALAGEVTFVDLCRKYKISRKTGYKWVRRFRDQGTLGLVDQSRRPLKSPLRVRPEVITELVRLKQQHRRWGAKKLWVLLSRHVAPHDRPSIATINRILASSGLAVRRRRYRETSKGLPVRPCVAVEAPNDLWTVDFKGCGARPTATAPTR